MGAKITKKLVKKIDKLTNQWMISINSDAVEEEIKNQLNKIQARVKIDGFRQGKAPIAEIDRIYGEDALYRAVNAIIRNTINDIVKDEKYKLAIQPEVSLNGEIKRREDISVGVKFVKKPEIGDIKYDKIEIETVELELSEKDKEEEIGNFRTLTATPKLAQDGKIVENGDIVDIDFIGRTADDNVEFSGGSAKSYRLEIGAKSFIEGFEEQLIGHKKGDDFEIKVKFPEQYHQSDLKGKDAIFKISLNDIYVKEIPELNDEFAKGLGFASLEKMKDLLYGNIKSMLEGRMKNMLKDKIFTAIIEKNKFDLPDSIIEREIEEKFENEKEKNKDNKSWDEKKAKKDIENNIRKSYAGIYLIDSIAEKNAIDVSDEEIKQVATQDAIRRGMDVKSVLQQLEKNDNVKNYIYFTLKETKVFDFIFDNIKKNVKKLDKKAFEKYLKEESERQNKKQ